MYFINLKDSCVLEESILESQIQIWYQMCLADPNLLVSEKWPIPRMKIQNGKLILKPELEWEVPLDISLDELKSKRKRELFNKYIERCEEGVEFEGAIFQTNEESVSRIGLALQDWVRGISTPYWIRKDNTHLPITSYPQFDSLVSAISLRWRLILHVRTTLRDEIETMNSEWLLSLNVASRWNEIEATLT